MALKEKIKNAFGEPRKGIHKTRLPSRKGARFSSTAASDYLATLAAAAIVSYIADIPLVLCTVIALVLGEVLHYVFGVRTNTLIYLQKLRETLPSMP